MGYFFNRQGEKLNINDIPVIVCYKKKSVNPPVIIFSHENVAHEVTAEMKRKALEWIKEVL